MLGLVYPPELQLNKANASDTETHFWIYIYLFQTGSIYLFQTAPLVADLFLFCYERDFMLSLSQDNQSGVIEE